MEQTYLSKASCVGNIALSIHRKVAGVLVDLRKIAMPMLNVVAENDDVVPPSSSLGLINAIRSIAS